VLDLENNEKYTAGIYNIKDKKYYQKQFKNVSSIEFTNNPNVLLYLLNDDMNRPYKLLQHTVGSDKDDTVIFEEKNDHMFLESTPTKDNSFLIINSLTKDDSEIYLINLKSNIANNIDNNNDNNEFKPIIQTLFERKAGVKYFIEHFNV